MKLYSKNESYILYQGDMLDMLEDIEENSIDAIITDPPYELGFMGKSWDKSGIVFQEETWKKCLKVLKPGGYLLCFGASRNFFRVFCAIEDAGFEIRDTIMWLYGSGMPKGQDLGKSIEAKLTLGSANTQDFKNLNDDKIIPKANGYSKMQFDQGNRPEHYTGKQSVTNVKLSNPIAIEFDGWNSTLKPAYEPIVVARKPFKGSLTQNVIDYGVGGLNIGECRIGFINDKDKKITVDKNQYWDKSDVESDIYSKYEGKKDYTEKEGGRFPSNVILTYDENTQKEVCDGFPNSKSTGGSGEKTVKSGLSGDVYNGGWSHEKAGANIGGLGDEGSAARYFKNCPYAKEDLEDIKRYFYCPKASKKDRSEGLEDFTPKTNTEEGHGLDRICKFCGESQLKGNCKCETKSWITKPKKNTHPTVKPSELMRYLVRLVTPNGGTVLDPFNGSGSTGKAVMLENRENDKNYKYVGIELTEEYLPISKARIESVCNQEKE